MNNLQRTPNTIPNEFKEEFKALRKRIEHLLAEFRADVRNEYEHPSLEPKKVGNIMEWGTLFEGRDGNISVQVGKEQFAMVRKEHIDRLKCLWILLIDIFIKHFSDRPSSSNLLQFKKEIEDNIALIMNTYVQYRSENKNEEANRILHQITMLNIHLMREGIPLSDDIKNKFYSTIFITKPET